MFVCLAVKSAQPTLLESPFYRVTVDPATGSIASIFDKKLNRELVDKQSPYGFGSYLYVTGGADPDSGMQQYRTAARPAKHVIPTGHPDSIDHIYRGLVTADGWKFVCLPKEPWLMFNLAEDPYEEINLAFNSAHSKRREQIGQRASVLRQIAWRNARLVRRTDGGSYPR